MQRVADLPEPPSTRRAVRHLPRSELLLFALLLLVIFLLVILILDGERVGLTLVGTLHSPTRRL